MAVYKKVPGHTTVNISTLEFDTKPTPGSLNPVTSGGVAEKVDQQSSNIAPEYTKKTYEANSYVMYGGILYTNPNAIGTAEDWNPAHWTQTTVAEMMAGAGATQWTHRTESLTIKGGATEEINVRDHEVLDLTIRRGIGSGVGNLIMHLYGECYIRLDKGYQISVTTLVGDSNIQTTDINSGAPRLDKSEVLAVVSSGSGIPDDYDPSEFDTNPVLDAGTDLVIDTYSPSLAGTLLALLHFLGDGTLVITPLSE